MTDAYRIHCTEDKHDERLRRFVDQCEGASVYHLPEWCDLIARVFKHKTSYLYAESTSGAVVGVLPLVNIDSRLFGNYMVSVPFLNYGGAVAVNNDIGRALMAEAAKVAQNCGSTHIEFRDVHGRDGWPVRTDKVTMVLQLPDDIEVVGKRIGAKVRSQIKRPLREGVEVVRGGSELLDEFYAVFSRNMRDLGTPVYGKDWFSGVLTSFPDLTKIIVIRLRGEAVGAAFLIGYKHRLEIPWASTVRKHNHLGINMLMYWEVLKYAIESGFKEFDFGRSSVDSGTYRFKKQWGAEPQQLYWHYWLRDGAEIPKLTPSNPKYRLAISVWQRLPLVVANWLGPKIVKNLP